MADPQVLFRKSAQVVAGSAETAAGALGLGPIMQITNAAERLTDAVTKTNPASLLRGINIFGKSEQERFHEELERLALQAKHTAEILQKMDKEAVDAEDMERIGDLLDKVLSRQKMSEDEAQEIVDTLDEMGKSLKAYQDKEANLKLGDIFKRYSSILKDERVSITTQQKVLEDIQKLLKEEGLGGLTEGAKLIQDLSVRKVNKQELSKLVVAVDEISDKTLQYKVKGNLLALDKKMDSLILTDQETSDLMKRKTSTGTPFREAFLQSPGEFTVGAARQGAVDTLLSSMGLGGFNQLFNISEKVDKVITAGWDKAKAKLGDIRKKAAAEASAEEAQFQREETVLQKVTGRLRDARGRFVSAKGTPSAAGEVATKDIHKSIQELTKVTDKKLTLVQKTFSDKLTVLDDDLEEVESELHTLNKVGVRAKLDQSSVSKIADLQAKRAEKKEGRGMFDFVGDAIQNYFLGKMGLKVLGGAGKGAIGATTAGAGAIGKGALGAMSNALKSALPRSIAARIPIIGGLLSAGMTAMGGGSAAEAVGSGAGATGGALIGAAIGTAIAPGVGTAIGGVLGGLIGEYGGRKAGSAISGAASGAAKPGEGASITGGKGSAGRISGTAQAEAMMTQYGKGGLEELRNYVDFPAGANLDKMDKDFMLNFMGMAKEYNTLTGKKLKVTDGYRPYEDQVKVFQSKPGLAAKPGTSRHGWGLAVDMSSAQANELDKLGLLGKWGFDRPMWPGKAGGVKEPWHVEAKGASGKINSLIAQAQGAAAETKGGAGAVQGGQDLKTQEQYAKAQLTPSGAGASTGASAGAGEATATARPVSPSLGGASPAGAVTASVGLETPGVAPVTPRLAAVEASTVRPPTTVAAGGQQNAQRRGTLTPTTKDNQIDDYGIMMTNSVLFG
jgi:hypothetical protein